MNLRTEDDAEADGMFRLDQIYDEVTKLKEDLQRDSVYIWKSYQKQLAHARQKRENALQHIASKFPNVAEKLSTIDHFKVREDTDLTLQDVALTVTFSEAQDIWSSSYEKTVRSQKPGPATIELNHDNIKLNATPSGDGKKTHPTTAQDSGITSKRQKVAGKAHTSTTVTKRSAIARRESFGVPLARARNRDKNAQRVPGEGACHHTRYLQDCPWTDRSTIDWDTVEVKGHYVFGYIFMVPAVEGKPVTYWDSFFVFECPAPHCNHPVLSTNPWHEESASKHLRGCSQEFADEHDMLKKFARMVVKANSLSRELSVKSIVCHNRKLMEQQSVNVIQKEKPESILLS